MENLKSFVSKKLIAVVVAVVGLICVGEYEMAKQVVMTYIGTQGAVDVAAALKKKIGG